MRSSSGGAFHEKELWVALSFLFVDTEVDFEWLVSVVRNYSVHEVEFALFERVAPVCIYNMLSPAPFVWLCFDEKSLIDDIELMIDIRSRQGFVGRCLSVVKGWILRLYCRETWGELKVKMEKAKEGF